MTVDAETDGVCVVACSGEFDQDTVGLLRDACERETTGAQLLVLDVRGVTFADSSFLNALIRLRHTRPLALAGPLPAQLHRLLNLTGAIALFEVREAGAA
ncbi:STAS domain-containing protein [Streptomyces roseus]|uniref:STAS domain-containing protein n=1 Tax=Streptomyces roseus TaxID=66430 RepID=UPI00131CB911|nr:STAS domain-containing protein [Streptomyces roseus]